MSTRSLFRRALATAGLLVLALGAGATAEPGPPAAADSVSGLTPVATAAPVAAKAAKPPLTGQWRLDPKASDDPMQMGAGQGGQSGQGSGQGGHGSGPGAGGHGPQLDPNQGKLPGEGFDGSEAPEQAKAQAAGREAAREFSELEIFLDGDEFNLTDGMQITRVLRIGGAPTEVFTPRGMVRAGAAWENDTLVVTELSPEGRPLCTRQFRLTEGGATLSVREIRHRSGKEGDHTMVMIYRREDAAARP